MKSIKTMSMGLALTLLMSPCFISAMDDSVGSVKKAQEYANYIKEHKGEEGFVPKEFDDYFTKTWFDKISNWTNDKVAVVGNSVKECYEWSKDKTVSGYNSAKDGFNSGITTIQENPQTSVAVGLGVAAVIGVSYVIYKKIKAYRQKCLQQQRQFMQDLGTDKETDDK